MFDDFNLLVSSARGNEREANSEVWYLVGELGDRSVRTDFTPVSGLTVAKTRLDPLSVVDGLKSVLSTRPWEFRYVLKIKPIRRVVPSAVDQIAAVAAEQAVDIAESETFRVAVEKRQSQIDSKTLIDAVAAKIPRKVDLKNPGKVVLVEIIGPLTGVAVIGSGQILGVEKEKRSSTQQARVKQISQ